jgi:hypothetical protein
MAYSSEATAIMRRIVEASNVDILMFNAPIERNRDRRLITATSRRKCRPNLLLILI